ncbi:MAG: ABC transporter permease [Desulfobacterales bacterium]|jgi:putative hydroxymethylpyrimidine transport system permease protein
MRPGKRTPKGRSAGGDTNPRPLLPALTVMLLALGFWEAACRGLSIPSFILPGPLQILKTAVSQAPLLASHATVTGLEILAGCGLSVLAAVPLAAAMFYSPQVERALSPFLVASQAIPVFALAPLLVIWLGYGLASKVLMAAVIIFFPITVTLLEGFKSCDPEYRLLFRLMGADFLTTFRRLYWPWALSYFFAGLKVGVSVATIGAVIGEWVGASRGLGYLMIQANARLQVDLVFAAILYLSVMGLCLWGLVGWVEKKILTWR